MKSLSPFFLTALGLLAATSVFSQNYVVVHIPPQSNDSGDISRAWQVNNKNEAVGEMEMLDGRTRPFHYNGGVVTDLGALGGLRGIAFGINDKGQIVGKAENADLDYHAFLYEKGKMTDLGTLGGGESIALAINKAGVIVGTADMVGSPVSSHAFVYKAKKMTSLGVLGAGRYSVADHISDSGWICGRSTTSPSSGEPTGFYYTGKNDIKSMGILPGGTASYASFVGPNNRIYGSSKISSGSYSQATVFNGDELIRLINDAEILDSSINGVNKAGVMVGKMSEPNNTGDRGFVMNPGGNPIPLTSLLIAEEDWKVSGAYSINDAGVIAASGRKAGISFSHALLLFPSPGKAIALTGAVSGVTTNAASLHGRVCANNDSGQWWMEYGPTGSFGSKTAAQSISGTSYSDVTTTLSGLKPHTNYNYRMVVKNKAGIIRGGAASFRTVNTLPVARDDLFFINDTKPATLNVVANDTDADKDKLAVTIGLSMMGTLVTKGKTLTYSGRDQFIGTDVLTYFVNDGFGGSAFANAYVMNSSFDGLLTEGEKDVGIVNLNITKQGSFTVNVRIGTTTMKWVAALDGNYHYSGQIKVKGQNPVALELNLNPETATVTGSVNNGTQYDFTLQNGLTVAKAYGNRKLTAVFMPGDDEAVPQGHGYGLMTINASGTISLKGKLADGTTYTAASKLRADGTCNVMLPLAYPKKAAGFVVGSLLFGDQTLTDSTGTLRWVKPATSGSFHPAGFDTSLDFEAAIYTPPASSTPALTFSSDTLATLSDGGLTEDITKGLTVSAKNAVVVNEKGDDKLALKIAPATGLLTGSFVHPGKRGSTKIEGVIYQKNNRGASGFFAGPATGGLIEIQP